MLTILNLVPNNIFAALSSNSVLLVVVIAGLIEFSYLSIKKKKALLAAQFESFLETAYTFVLPYGSHRMVY
jgi:L-cystine uptake protein TcyP (sodium:dicarboxylate symporter family)